MIFVDRLVKEAEEILAKQVEEGIADARSIAYVLEIYQKYIEYLEEANDILQEQSV